MYANGLASIKKTIKMDTTYYAIVISDIRFSTMIPVICEEFIIMFFLL